jgi:hypothetical protein
MIEDGDNPFKGLPVSDNERSTEVSDMAGDDSELVEVVESFEEE